MIEGIRGHALDDGDVIDRLAEIREELAEDFGLLIRIWVSVEEVLGVGKNGEEGKSLWEVFGEFEFVGGMESGAERVVLVVDESGEEFEDFLGRVEVEVLAGKRGRVNI